MFKKSASRPTLGQSFIFPAPHGGDVNAGPRGQFGLGPVVPLTKRFEVDFGAHDAINMHNAHWSVNAKCIVKLCKMQG